MADNRIDFVRDGKKYFAELVKLTDLRNDDPEKDKGFVFVYDLATMPKGISAKDLELNPKTFPLTPPGGFGFIIGKYPEAVKQIEI